jgi:hypothetical protein
MTEHVNMADFIAPRSDQLNSDELIDGPRTITVTKVTAQPDAAEQPVSVHFEGDNSRPFKPCKTVRRLMVSVWGKDASQYVGRSMTLYRDPTVAFGGMQVGGIRVSHMSHIDEKKTVALQVTRGRKAPYTVQPLKVEAPATADDGQAAALRALTEAATRGTDALATVWKQKGMAPYRDALQFDLERLKEVAAKVGSEPEQPDRAAEQSPDVNDQAEEPTAAEIAVAKVIADTEAAPDLAVLNKIIADADPHRAFMPDELLIKLDVAFDRARQRLEPAKESAE